MLMASIAYCIAHCQRLDNFRELSGMRPPASQIAVYRYVAACVVSDKHISGEIQANDRIREKKGRGF